LCLLFSFGVAEITTTRHKVAMTLEKITSRIAKAEKLANRPIGSTNLIAVSKVQPNARVLQVLQQGHRLFGENKVQEAQGKWPDFRIEFPEAQVHLIGPLQTNKVKATVALFDAIHSVDRVKLARKLADEVQNQGRSPQMFIQVNTGEEPQKAGVLPAQADGFIQECRGMDLNITGLMVIPPVDEEPALHFALLAKIAARNGLTGLSMGMSSDFERAVALGATHVRVGSAIFGERSYG